MTGDSNRPGESDRTGDDAEPTSTISPNSYRVLGEMSETGTSGVYGRNTNGSGTNYGVYGEIDTNSMYAGGVFGEAHDAGAKGVVGLANVNSPVGYSSGAAIYGEVDDEGAHGLIARNTTQSGADSEGVLAFTGSPDSPAITGWNESDGVGVRSKGDLDVDGNAEVSGRLDVGDVGVSAYTLDSQDVSTDTETTVVFERTAADHFDGFDTSTGVYTIPVPGAYRVTAAVEWGDRLAGGTEHTLSIKVGGVSRARRHQEVPGDPSERARIHDHVSKTLYGLSADDEVSVTVEHDAGSDKSLDVGHDDTYVTIDRVG